MLIGHNYKSGAHFGILKKLEVGDENLLNRQRNRYARSLRSCTRSRALRRTRFSALKTYQGDYGTHVDDLQGQRGHKPPARALREKAAG